MINSQARIQRVHFRSASNSHTDGFSWFVETTEDGHEVTSVTVPRVVPVLEALKAFRTDLRLRSICGESLTFEVVEAA